MITPIDSAQGLITWIVVASAITVLFSGIVVPWLYTNKRDTGYFFRSETDVFKLCGVYLLPFCAWAGLAIHAMVGGFATVQVSGTVAFVNGSVVNMEGVERSVRFSEDVSFNRGNTITVECYDNPEELDCFTPEVTSTGSLAQ